MRKFGTLIVTCFNFFSIIAVMHLSVSCGKDEPDNPVGPVAVEMAPLGEWTVDMLPVIDGSDSTEPLRMILASKLLGGEYSWKRDAFTLTPFGIKSVYIDQGLSDQARTVLREKFINSNTHGSFVKLIDGDAELIITARNISRDETTYRMEKGIELLSKPIAHDALAFMLNPQNPVETLSTEQIQGIYSGRIRNWSEVGGPDAAIVPFIRNPNSGSQEKFETMVMKDIPLADSEILEIGTTMITPYNQLEHSRYGIAFTPFYYFDVMVNSGSTKVIGVDGVAMNRGRIMDGSYPFVTEVFVSVRKDIDKESNAYRLYEFMTTEAGQEIVAESGYVSLNKIRY